MADHFWPDMPAPELSLTPLPTWPSPATTLCLCFPCTAELLKGVIRTCAGQCCGHQPHLAVKQVRKYWKCLIHPRFQKQSTKVNSLSNRILITCYGREIIYSFLGGSGVQNPPANAGDMGSIPGLGRSAGEGNGSQLQCSCLENPMDRGAWQAMVHGVTKSRTPLRDFHFHCVIQSICSF